MVGTLIISLLMLIAGIGIGVSLTKSDGKPNTTTCQLQYKYLNKQLGCQEAYTIEKHDYKALKSTVQDYIDSLTSQGKAEEVAMYFRDLYNGPIMGINEDATFAPASLLKVPLALTYLSLAEEDKSLLQKHVGFEEEIDTSGQNLPPEKTIEIGKPYTIEELLRKMLVFSDNRSYEVLNAYVEKLSPDKNLLLETYRDLGIVDSQSKLDDTITVKNYASIFRALYHASYLSQEMSDKVLSMLAQSEFSEGLEVGMPKEVEAAHKFGERVIVTKNPQGQVVPQTIQFHDCGIVYYPDNPYLLCIMTRGDDASELKAVIAQVSKMVYQEVDSRRIR